MQRISTLLLAVTTSACGTTRTPAPDAPATVQWDSTTAGEVRSVVERGVNSMAQMDIEGVKSVLSDDWTFASFDTDMETKPLRLATRDDVIKYAEDVSAEVKKLNATFEIDAKSLECRGTSTLAYCVLDHEVTATMPQSKPMVQPQRATFVLAKGAAGWKWVHFHSSPGPAASK